MSHIRLLSLFLGGALVLLTGCSNREDKIAVESRAGILHLGNLSEIVDLDPQVTTGVSEHNVQMALFEGLVEPDPVDLSPSPGVAKEWSVSEDGRTWTFHLRDNAKWTNGDPVTANDFVQSYKRMLTRELGAQYAYMLFNYVENAKAYYDGEISDFSQVGFTAVDPYTLEVRLVHPVPYFLDLLSQHNSWYPVPIKVIEKFGGLTRKDTNWTRLENFVGNGPFRLRERRFGDRIVVERNPDYWDAANVRLNEIHFHVIETEDTEERAFRGGLIHRTYTMPAAKIDRYRAEAPELLHIDPYFGTYFYRFNVTRPPLDDGRVRRALALAIDREAIVEQITRGGQKPAYRFTPAVRGYDPDVRLTGDIAEAQRLLAEAGFPEGRGFPVLELLYNTLESHKTIAEAIDHMWRENLGISVRLANKEWGVYLDAQHSLDYEISRSAWIGDFPDPYTFLDMFATGGGNNDTGWSNARYDELLQKASAAMSNEDRFAIYAELEQILVDELPIMPIYFYTSQHLMDPAVKGLYPNSRDLHPYKHIWLEAPAE